jgi:LSD1 subclass zinc finger protein
MSDFVEATKRVNEELACQGCGAMLKFKPGTLNLTCEYCGAANEIAPVEEAGKVQELNLADFLAKNFEREETFTAASVKCESCGATSTLDPAVSSDKCPFCAMPLVVKSGTTSTLHKPHYVLPFGIDHDNAKKNFAHWIKRLWFAPNDLKHYADRAERLNGMYLPFWTFDCTTDSNYSGQRGEDYHVTERYTAHENGKSVTRTRQVRKTRWYPAHGKVSNAFDDVLIEATTSLNKNKLRSLEPWDLKNLMPYNDKYLSGFRTETYTTDVKAGFEEGKERMELVIRDTIRKDIGGDRQLIHSISTAYHNPTFKHVLLPVYLSAFRYKDKAYQFLVNARTGEVQGDRPYSTVKITLAVLAGLIVAFVIWWFTKDQN